MITAQINDETEEEGKMFITFQIEGNETNKGSSD